MHAPITPSNIAPPAARYAHAVLTTEPRRWLHTSGVVPVLPDGTVPAGIGEQAEAVWSNIAAMLTAAEMTPSDVVSVTTYVVPDQDLRAVMAARDRFLGGHLAASTLLVVARLARSPWLIEVSVVAAS